MTTVIILMYGAGAILLISGLSTDPNTGDSPTIIGTLMEIWNGTPDTSQAGNGGATKPIPPKGKGTGAPDYNVQYWIQQRYA